MAGKPRFERIEIPVEDLTDTRRRAGHDLELADHEPAITRPRPPDYTAAPSETSPRSIGDMSSSFRLLVRVPGGELSPALGGWWQRADHGDDHLRLEQPRRTGDSWSISGALRQTIVSRWVPVELVLTPYAERFTLIEMSPRRVVHPTRLYFRAGHRSLDRFVAAVSTQCRPRGREQSAQEGSVVAGW
jgi:hypothetical protein